jgi:hypothetical protein
MKGLAIIIIIIISGGEGWWSIQMTSPDLASRDLMGGAAILNILLPHICSPISDGFFGWYTITFFFFTGFTCKLDFLTLQGSWVWLVLCG